MEFWDCNGDSLSGVSAAVHGCLCWRRSLVGVFATSDLDTGGAVNAFSWLRTNPYAGAGDWRQWPQRGLHVRHFLNSHSVRRYPVSRSSQLARTSFKLLQQVEVLCCVHACAPVINQLKYCLEERMAARQNVHGAQLKLNSVGRRGRGCQ